MSRRWGAAETVLTLSVGLLIIVFAIFGLLVWQGYDKTLADAQKSAQSGADVVSEDTRWLVGSSLLLLDRVNSAIDGDPARFTGPVRGGLMNAAKALPWPVKLAVFDAQGHAVVADGAGMAPSDISGTAYYKVLAAGQDWQMSPAEASPPDGKPLLVIAKRLTRSGSMSGVALLQIDADMLASFWAPLDNGAGSTVSIVRGDGLVVARYPTLDKPINLGALPVFKTLMASQSGTYISPSSPADGVARIVAFQHIPELGLIALASSAEESVLKTLWDAVRTVLLLMGPIAAALLFVALLSARLLRQSERTRRQLEEALARNQTLLREVHHRVKNNLQSVASLVQLQPISPEIKVEMGRRIAAMSAVHEQIYRSDNFGAVEIKGYLHTLIGSLRQSYRSDAEVLERLDDLMVDTDTAMPLALIVNEVVSNAFKHAFADGREGMIVITLERVDEATGVLTIEDNGVGFDPSQPASGMGRRLIAGLTEQLGGTSRFVREGGSRFSLTFPLLEPPKGP